MRLKFGEHAFSVPAPKAWNYLPLLKTMIPSSGDLNVTNYACQLKTDQNGVEVWPNASTHQGQGQGHPCQLILCNVLPHSLLDCSTTLYNLFLFVIIIIIIIIINSKKIVKKKFGNAPKLKKNLNQRCTQCTQKDSAVHFYWSPKSFIRGLCRSPSGACTHQMAALFRGKRSHDHHLERITSWNPTISKSMHVFTWTTTLPYFSPLRFETMEPLAFSRRSPNKKNSIKMCSDAIAVPGPEILYFTRKIWATSLKF